jgi:hypothetical protein
MRLSNWQSEKYSKKFLQRTGLAACLSFKFEHSTKIPNHECQKMLYY